MTTIETAELRQLLWVAEEKKKCAAKTKFYSEGAATVKRPAHSKHTPPKLWPYHCAWCGYWHVSSSQPRDAMRRAA